MELVVTKPRSVRSWLGDFITATWLELDRLCSAERVSTGLLCTRIGLQPVGREMLAAADYVSCY